ncbi:MAG: SPOR domain-containing protein [Ideonella sp.]
MPAESDSVDSVSRARSRARQRLLGAVVLVGIGIIGFPLLFETQPRPIPVDVPIEIPARDSVAPLKLPGAKDGQVSAKGAADSEHSSSPKAAKSEPMITETAAEAGAPVAPEKAAAPADRSRAEVAEKAADRNAAKITEKSAEKAAETIDEKTDEKVSEKAVAKAAEKGSDKPAHKPVEPNQNQQADAARARALLEGKMASKDAAATGRYIVQIGAFADPLLARATRLRVERLGLVTYTHVAKTPAGERTRVRVGPVASRDEAEKIAAKIKAAGLPTAILTL